MLFKEDLIKLSFSQKMPTRSELMATNCGGRKEVSFIKIYSYENNITIIRTKDMF